MRVMTHLRFFTPLAGSFMLRRPRIFVAGLFHETHTFLDGDTKWEDFYAVQGDNLLELRGDSSPIGGVLERASQLQWDVVPGIWAAAHPSAVVTDAAFERYWKEFSTLLAECANSGPIDGIYLVLHGAMTCESIQDVEGELLERLGLQLEELRAVDNEQRLDPHLPIPIFGVYDLHANFTARMARYAQCLVAYRENPHADARESAVRAADLLDRCLKTKHLPHMVLIQPPIVWPPTGTGTASVPMQSLLQTARRLQEQHPEFWEINVTAGFAFADTLDTGVSFGIVTTGSDDAAQSGLRQLFEQAMQLAEEGNVIERPVDEVLAALPRDEPGLLVIVEPSDNIGGGAPGDCTGLLRAFLSHGITNAGVCIWDAESVRQLETHSSGEQVTLSIGGRGSRLDPGPLTLTVTLHRLTDGLFTLHDQQSHLASMVGSRFDMGRCAVVECDGITILLTSNRTPPMDLGQWYHVGIDPAQYSFVGVKAAVAHRRAWDAISKGNVWVSTPGPCASDLKQLPYCNIRRPIFPLDSMYDLKNGIQQ